MEQRQPNSCEMQIPEGIAKFHWKILFLSGLINCWISITKYLCYQPTWRYASKPLCSCTFA